MKGLLLVMLIALLGLVPETGAGGEVDEVSTGYGTEKIPDLFKTGQEARRMGCRMAALKGDRQPSCFLPKYDLMERTFLVTFYDSNDQGQWVRSGQLCFPSWHGRAKVKTKDILGTGQEFLLVEFEGNTGSGVLQMILMMLGWFDGRFKPVLAETISYDRNVMGAEEHLSMNYSLKKNASQRILHLRFKQDRRPSRSEDLVWDEQAHSFYQEGEKRKKLEGAASFCGDFLETSGLID